MSAIDAEEVKQFVQAARRALDIIERDPDEVRAILMAVRRNGAVDWLPDRPRRLVDDTVYLSAGTEQTPAALYVSMGKKLFQAGARFTKEEGRPNGSS